MHNVRSYVGILLVHIYVCNYWLLTHVFSDFANDDTKYFKLKYLKVWMVSPIYAREQPMLIQYIITKWLLAIVTVTYIYVIYFVYAAVC